MTFSYLSGYSVAALFDKHISLFCGCPWRPAGLKGNRLQKRLAGSYFAAFSAHRITIGLQNPQNLPSSSHFFCGDSSSPTGS
jgi:hypothetical protein